MVVAHVRDEVTPIAQPTWDDVAPILKQYANVYPVMQQIVDLNDEDSVTSVRDAMLLAFSLDITDPASMPTSRDLSAGKRRIITQWLEGLAPATSARARAGDGPERTPPTDRERTASADSKTRFAAAFEKAVRERGAE
jgi:hypothetical protein